MKLRRTYDKTRKNIKTAVCITAAALIFLISFPSFAAEESGTEEVPETETVMTADEITEDTEEADEDDEETGTETVQTGYVTMKAVSGNPSVTN